jgi:hypothetical protein
MDKYEAAVVRRKLREALAKYASALLDTEGLPNGSDEREMVVAAQHEAQQTLDMLEPREP